MVYRLGIDAAVAGTPLVLWVLDKRLPVKSGEIENSRCPGDTAEDIPPVLWSTGIERVHFEV